MCTNGDLLSSTKNEILMSGDDPSDYSLNSDDLGKISESEQLIHDSGDSNCQEVESIIDTSKNETDVNIRGESFSNSSQLKRHLNVHAAKEQYRCMFCDKVYLLRFSLNSHLKTHRHNVPVAPEPADMEIVKEEIEMHEHHLSEDICESEPFEEDKMIELLSAPEVDDAHTFSSSESKPQSNIVADDKPTSPHPLECDICSKTFTRKSRMLTHRNSHTAEKQYVCQYCGEVYLLPTSLKSHLETHMDKRSFQCDICHKRFFQRSLLLLHKNVHTSNNQFKCEYCDNVYLRQDSLRQHLEIHIKNLSCVICSKTFSRKDSLLAHRNSHTANEQYVCHHCGKVYLIKKSLRIHLGMHMDKLQCEICHKRFTRRSLWLLHKNVHTANKQFKCEYCGKVYLLQDSLREHLQKIHQNTDRVNCDICNKSFTRKNHLLQHRNSHTASKQYVCHHCGKVYLIKNSLVRHLETHMEKRSFQCDICHKRFTRKYRMLSHKNSHTGKSLSKQFKCEHCDKVYLMRSSLNRHLKTHLRNIPVAPEPSGMGDSKEKIEIHEHDLSEELCKGEPFEEEK